MNSPVIQKHTLFEKFYFRITKILTISSISLLLGILSGILINILTNVENDEYKCSMILIIVGMIILSLLLYMYNKFNEQFINKKTSKLPFNDIDIWYLAILDNKDWKYYFISLTMSFITLMIWALVLINISNQKISRELSLKEKELTGSIKSIEDSLLILNISIRNRDFDLQELRDSLFLLNRKVTSIESKMLK